MKKLFKALLALAFVFTLGACGEEKPQTSIDMSNFPANFAEWTTQDVIDYMVAKEVFTNEEWAYVQTKDDPINPAPDPLSELGSYLSTDGMIGSLIYYYDLTNGSDVVKAGHEEVKTEKVVNMQYVEGVFPYPSDHMIGQFAFADGSADLEYKEKWENALKDLAKDVNVEMTY